MVSRKYYVAIIALLICSDLLGQAAMTVLARSQGDTIDLRLIPLEVDVYLAAYNNGIDVQRVTLSDGNVAYGPSAIEASRVTIANVTPWDSIAIVNDPDLTPDMRTAAIELLYGPEFNLTYTPSTIREVVKIQEAPENKLVFSLFMADSDLHLAEVLGLATSDHDVTYNSVYRYEIGVTMDTGIYKTSIDVKADNTLGGQPPSLSGLAGVEVARLEWSTLTDMTPYPTYNIYRSTDSLSGYQKLNDIPYSYSSEEPIAQYSDTIPPGTTYYYQIRGNTVFAQEGPASNTVAIQAIPPPLTFEIKAYATDVTSELAVL